MAEIFDFNKYKNAKDKATEYADDLEASYLTLLKLLHETMGPPKDYNDLLKYLYVGMREVEGTINSLVFLAILGLIPDIEGFKKNTIDWLQSLIDSIDSI